MANAIFLPHLIALIVGFNPLKPTRAVKTIFVVSVSTTFSRDEVRETVLSGYMGLIKQIDDNLGKLFKFLTDTKKMENIRIKIEEFYFEKVTYLAPKACGAARTKTEKAAFSVASDFSSAIL